MKIDLTKQIMVDATLPIGPVRTFTGSALPLELVGIPARRHGYDVAGVTVRLTNADNMPIEAAADRYGDEWRTLFAASNFARYGEIQNGAVIELTLSRADGTTAVERIGAGLFEIVASSPSALPGTPGTFYVVKGDRCFVRSHVSGGVQHYVEQTMEYDTEIGWGANWSGDYILDSSGNFVEYTEA